MLARQSDQSANARDVDHGTAIALEEVIRRRVGDLVGAVQVDVQHAVEALGVDVSGRPSASSGLKPALLTTISTPPNSAAARSMTVRTASDRSRPRGRRPRHRPRLRLPPRRPRSRPPSGRSGPPQPLRSPVRRRWRPMPRPPPVTTATPPSRSNNSLIGPPFRRRLRQAFRAVPACRTFLSPSWEFARGRGSRRGATSRAARAFPASALGVRPRRDPHPRQ